MVDATSPSLSGGASPEGLHKANPNLPLWAAVALVLESTGRFHHH